MHTGSEIRPGVVAAAGSVVAIAVGLWAFALAPAVPESARAGAATATRAAEPRRTEPEPVSDTAPLPLPSRTRSAALSPARRAPVAAVAAPAEPQWDGKGTPSREWMRWQLEALVAQIHPHGSVSQGALDSAVEDALALHAAKRELASLADPAAIESAQDRARRASENLAISLGVEGVEIPTFD